MQYTVLYSTGTCIIGNTVSQACRSNIWCMCWSSNKSYYKQLQCDKQGIRRCRSWTVEEEFALQIYRHKIVITMLFPYTKYTKSGNNRKRHHPCRVIASQESWLNKFYPNFKTRSQEGVNVIRRDRGVSNPKQKYLYTVIIDADDWLPMRIATLTEITEKYPIIAEHKALFVINKPAIRVNYVHYFCV